MTFYRVETSTDPHKMESQMFINEELLTASVYFNGYSPFIPSSTAIGLKPNLIKYTQRTQLPLLAEDYLLNSYYVRDDAENRLSAEHFYSDASLVTQSLNNQRDYLDLTEIALPMSVTLYMSLGEAILRRRSVSQFTGDAIDINYLATIARCARGISDKVTAQLEHGGEVKLDFSTVSSAGRLYPVDIYFVVLNVKGLDQGIYHYVEHKDVLIKKGNKKNVTDILETFAMPENSVVHARANYICLFVAHPWKSMSKYGNRGLRFILQEIGSIAQNIHLANIGLGLGSMDWGGYYENEMNQVLGFDGMNQSVLHTVLAGVAN